MQIVAKILLGLTISIGGYSLPFEATTVHASTSDEAEQESFSPFHPSENAMAEVDALLEAAVSEQKLAMIILGANWCHDSIGFMRHLENAAVRKVIDQRYVVKTIDVGFLEHGRDIIIRFGLKAIYGTPTVMIIDPATETLLNVETIHTWRDAAAMSDSEVAQLLASQPATRPSREDGPPALQRLLEEIDTFEAKHAARIYEAFAVIGPMLAAEERPADFGHYWGQVRDLRYSITEDLRKLRLEARTRVTAGETEVSLPYPDYPAFDWEK